MPIRTSPNASPALLVHERRAAEQFHLPGQALSQAFGNADGAFVRGPDEADHTLALERAEGVVQAGPGCLDGVTLPPVSARQHPPELEARPARRIEEAHAAGELSAGRHLRGEHPVAEQL